MGFKEQERNHHNGFSDERSKVDLWYRANKLILDDQFIRDTDIVYGLVWKTDVKET